MGNKHWYKLDNSAKIMPSMTNGVNTNVFRLSCTLKEEIDAEILEHALHEACSEFPLFLCTMKSGLFWHYLETANEVPHVQEEKTSPCAKMDGELLFRLSYYKRRINLEVYHVLADGAGAMEFLKYTVACYLDEKYGIYQHEKINTASMYAKASDDFSKFDKASRKLKISKNKRAYKLKFARKDDSIPDVIEIKVSSGEIREIAHKYDATVTTYLTAVLIMSIAKCAKIKDLKRPIGITVPIDLRGVFPSETTRNFFYTVCIQYAYREEDGLEDIVEILKKKFAHDFSKDSLQELLDSYMVLENLLLIRIIPNILKDFILGLITGPRSTETMALSNMGIINMPEIYSPHIESFSGFMNSTGLHLTAMTFKDELTLGFTTHFVTNEIERNMVKILKQEGVKDVRVVTNKRK